MARRGEHTGKELSEMLINAAFNLVRENGYHKVSTRKIAAEIGYTVGSLYALFRNYEDILVGVNSRTLDMLLSYLTAECDKILTPNILEELGLAYWRFASKEKHLWSLLFEYHFQSIESPPWYIKQIQAFELQVQHIMQKAMSTKTNTEIMEIFSLFWPAVHGIVILSQRGKLDRAAIMPAETLIKNMAQLFISKHV